MSEKKYGKIYQFNDNLELIAEFSTLLEAETTTGISLKTISSAIAKSSRCHNQWYFSRSLHIVPCREYIDEPLTYKIMLVLSKSLGEEFLSVIGQQNKQAILRNLIRDWVDKQKTLNK